MTGARLAVGAVILDAISINLQRVIVDGESALLGDAMLTFFNFAVDKLLDLAALNTDQVIVVIALVQFKYGLVTVKVVAHQQAGLLKLGQHSVYRRQADFLTLVGQQPINLLRRHVSLVALLEQIENLQAGKRGFETNALEIRGIAQWGLQIGCVNTL